MFKHKLMYVFVTILLDCLMIISYCNSNYQYIYICVYIIIYIYVCIYVCMHIIINTVVADKFDIENFHHW